MKRILDITLSSIGIIILLPVFLIVGLVIYFEDRNSIIFKQARVGKHRKVFWLYKFRSMRVNTSKNGKDFTPGDTSRITSVGSFLRTTKIDELPQLFNVLKGDMSIVGPRPEVQEWTKVYSDRWDFVLKVKPGITDVASIEFHNEEELLDLSANPEATYRIEILPRKLTLYEDYVKNHTVSKDFRIIFKSFYIILNGVCNHLP